METKQATPTLSVSHHDIAQHYIANAAVLAEISGRILCRDFVREGICVDEKDDRSIVTESDLRAEEAMRDYLRRTFPSHGIVGEEFGSENTDAEFVWYLDPIDGTISFVTGVPLFGTLIGLCYQGEPILGIVNQPILNQLCIGTNRESRLNGKAIHVRSQSRLSEATLLTTDFQHVEKYQSTSRFAALTSLVKHSRTWGDCYGYLLVAAGRADIMLDPIMQLWDIIPIIPIIRGAGGHISDWRGNSPINATSCIAAHPSLHHAVLETLHAGSQTQSQQS